MVEEKITAAVITVSDRCSQGVREDRSGPLAVELIRAEGFTCADPVVVSDDAANIRSAIETAISRGNRFIFTTGGTGFTPRDITPETVIPLIEVRLPGVENQIYNLGLAATERAALSRQVVGLTGRDENASLIVSAPGSVGGVKDACAVVLPLLSHLFALLAGADH